MLAHGTLARFVLVKGASAVRAQSVAEQPVGLLIRQELVAGVPLLRWSGEVHLAKTSGRCLAVLPRRASQGW